MTWAPAKPRGSYDRAVRRIAVLLAVVPGVALAQPAPNDSVTAIHDRAVALATAGWATKDPVQLNAAVAEFKRAIALDDQPKFECNLAVALEGLGELARAHARLSRCAPRLAAIDPELARPRLAKLAELEAALVTTHAALRLAVSDGPATATISAFPDDEIMTLPTTVWLAPGSPTLIVRFPGRRAPSLQVVAITAAEVGTKQALQIETPREAPLEPPPDELQPREPVVEPPRARPRSRRAATIVLAAGGAAIVGGAVVHVLSREPRRHLATLSGPGYDDYRSTWRAYQWSTIGLYGAGTVALGIGAYLWFRDRGSPVAVTPTPRGDGAMVSWTLAR